MGILIVVSTLGLVGVIIHRMGSHTPSTSAALSAPAVPLQDAPARPVLPAGTHLISMARVRDDLLALQDRARSLQDELTSNQAEETNHRLYIVSVGTTLMLPATFVTGFFGMNTGGMFLTDGSWGTVEAGGLCFAIMLGTWVLLKFTRLL